MQLEPSRVKALLSRAERRCLAVAGGGRTGLAAAAALHAAGYEVVVIDETELSEERQEEFARRGAAVLSGFKPQRDAAELARRAPVAAVLSPGVRGEAALVKFLRANAVPAISELDLACALFGMPEIAVSGTNGKSTVLALLEEMFVSAGRAYRATGHAVSALEVLKGGPRRGDEAWLLEVSSFQLEEAVDFAPRVAVLTGVGTDHLEGHGSREDYVRAKSRLLLGVKAAAGAAVVNIECRTAAELAAKAGGNVVAVQRAAPLEAEPDSAWLEHSRIICSLRGSRHEFSLENFSLLGVHNRINAALAAAAALLAGIPEAAVQSALDTARPRPHHLRVVAAPGSRVFINDSAATNPEATAAALEAVFAAYAGRGVAAIVGGRMKAGDWDGALKLLSACRAVVLFGESAGQLQAMLEKRRGELPPQLRKERSVLVAATPADAVSAAKRATAADGVILFSPGCSSFDSYPSYADRGQAFCEALGEK